MGDELDPVEEDAIEDVMAAKLASDDLRGKPRQKQQIFGEANQSIDLLTARREDFVALLDGVAGAQRDLDFALQDR